MSEKPSTGSRPQSTRSRTSTVEAPHLHRVLSMSHPDDHSVYHGQDDHHQPEPEHEQDEESTQSPDSDSTTESEGMSDMEEERRENELAGTISEVRMGVADERDVEAGPPRPPLEKSRSSRSARDRNLVTWDGPDDPLNPKNWPMRSKWAATSVVSCFTFISPVSSSMVAPALTTMAKEFGVTSEVESQLMLSVFVLAYAVGPLFLGPLSEVYGRVPVLQLANLFYLVWNIACGVCQSKSQMIAFRFLSGLGGSAPLAVGGGVLSDCWRPEERGKAIAIYSLAPLLGPAVGPIAGGFITQNTTWRWVFYATSIADGVIQVFGLFYLRETYHPKILKAKANRLRKETGNDALHTEYEGKTLGSLLRTSLIRPFRLLATQPIVQILAIYMAFLYGLMYLVLSTFPTLWVERYHESIGISGLNYIAMGLGFFLGTQICAPINDRIYRRLKARNNNVGRPEFRVPLMVPGSLLTPIGLFWYGWSAQAHTHWIVPNIGVTIFCAGIIVGFQCIQTYIVDSYTRYAASAVAAATVLRSLAGFGFPLFAPTMYNALDYGWGNSLLAFIAIGLGVPAPFFLWKWGASLRAKSTFAAGGG